MRQVFASLLTLCCSIGFSLNSHAQVRSKALMPAPNQAPVGFLPYTGAPTAMNMQSPYGPTFQGAAYAPATGSFAYSPAQMPQYPNAAMMAQANPQMCAMNPMMCNQMYSQQMGGMYGAMPGMMPAQTTPTINPAMMMAALAALPGLAYDWQQSWNSKSSDIDRDREYNRSRDREYTRSRDRESSRARDSDRVTRDRENVRRSPRLADRAETPARADRAAEAPARPPESAPERRVEPPAAPVEPKAPKLSDNDVRGTLDRIEQANRIQPAATSPQTAPPPQPECRDCETPSARAEQCTSENNYFEQMLSTADNDGVKIAKAHASSSNSIKCISEALKSVNNDRVQFVSCPNAGAALGASVSRPCASDNKVKTMAGAYELVTDCLAGFMDSRANSENGQVARASVRKTMFQVWNYESGWSMNAARKSARSANGGGPGQLVTPVIEYINKKDGTNPSRFDQMKSYIKSSSNRSCKMMARYDFKPMRADRANACDRIAIENGNPMLNMMYSMAFLKAIRGSLARTVDSVDGVNPQARERLLTDLTVWGQGAGGEPISVAFNKVLKSDGRRLLGTPFDEQKYAAFMELMKKEVKTTLQKFVADNPRAAIDPESDSGYLERSQTELVNLNTRINGECGQF